MSELSKFLMLTAVIALAVITVRWHNAPAPASDCQSLSGPFIACKRDEKTDRLPLLKGGRQTIKPWLRLRF